MPNDKTMLLAQFSESVCRRGFSCQEQVIGQVEKVQGIQAIVHNARQQRLLMVINPDADLAAVAQDLSGIQGLLNVRRYD